MIKVLVVDNSAVARSLILHILGTDPEICVVGTAANGAEALKAVKLQQPDVITMDINMPRMDGLEATRQIMETRPTPIVVVSGLIVASDAGQPTNSLTLRAMDAGALAVLPSPRGIGHPGYAAASKELLRTVKMMSEVKVVRRWARLRGTVPGSALTTAQLTEPLATGHIRSREASGMKGINNNAIGISRRTVRLVAIGASTGGPPVLRTILSGLTPDFPVPIVIVQHIAAGFTSSFAEWLATSSGYPVSIAIDGEFMAAGKAYVAPDGIHMGVDPGNRVVLSVAPLEHGMRPAVSFLFRSVTASLGANALGVLLTGMGKDGAQELKVLRDLGATTIAQDFESSIVHGMPGEAILLGGATYVRPADKIAGLMTSLVTNYELPQPTIRNP